MKPPIPAEVTQIFESADAIFWDFDGVILDSMSVRDLAFRHALAEYPVESVDKLVSWHRANGGLSRYVKFRRFQEVVLCVPADEEIVQSWSNDFSSYCREKLGDTGLLIPETLAAIRQFESRLPQHIVSGSDGNELRQLCNELKIDSYFRTIDGSPTPKVDLVQKILESRGYNRTSTWLIGDSINDLEAARACGIKFAGFNNKNLADHSDHYWCSSCQV